MTVPEGLPSDLTETPLSGLSQAEAEKRHKNGLSNAVKKEPGKSLWQIMAGNLFTAFNLLNFALAGCLIAVGSYRNMLFLGVVFSNTLIGAVQELRARRTIQQLQLLNTPVIHAYRDGRELALSPDELVKGDVVVLRAGDQVPADAIVLTGVGAADESLLTGESDAVPKRRHQWLMSGSFITEGHFLAQLERVGDESYAAQLTSAARKIKRPKSILMSDLNRLVHAISIALGPIGLLLLFKQTHVLKSSLEQAVPTVVAAMIGMIPEGLVLLTSMALAVGVVRLGKRQTLVSELYGIETLARADVLCLDKTGTLTTGSMRLERLIPVEAREDELREALGRFLSAFTPDTPTLRALCAAVPAAGAENAAVLPFSSERKLSAAAFDDGVTLILGAPQFVLDDCAAVQALLDAETAQGRRVLALYEAHGPLGGENACPRPERVLGILSLSDEIRAGAQDTLRWFAEQGVQLKVISGDDPVTVSRIGQAVGLPFADRYVDASALKTEEALAEAASDNAVFGRVTPEQKRQLVEALKRAGHSVAMTGDGVNDIPALKAADCSIAMGSGANAARQVAQLTLLSGDFSALPAVVAEGRRVVGNIRRTATLFLVKTLYSAAISLLLLILPLHYPFVPIQLTLLSSLTIGIPGFFLALEPNQERIQGAFLPTVLRRAAPGAAAIAVCAVLAMNCVWLGGSIDDCSTVAVLTAGTFGLVELAFACLPLNRLRAAVLAGMTLSFINVVAFGGKIFFLNVRGLSATLWGALVLLVLIGSGVMYLTNRLLNTRRGTSIRP